MAIDTEFLIKEFGFDEEATQSLTLLLDEISSTGDLRELIKDVELLVDSLSKARRQLEKIKKAAPKYYSDICTDFGRGKSVDDKANQLTFDAIYWLSHFETMAAIESEPFMTWLNSIPKAGVESELANKYGDKDIELALKSAQKTTRSRNLRTGDIYEIKIKDGFIANKARHESLWLVRLAEFWIRHKGKIPQTVSHEFYRFSAVVLRWEEIKNFDCVRPGETEGISIGDKFKRLIDVSKHLG